MAGESPDNISKTSLNKNILIERIKKGDNKAAEILYLCHIGYLTAVCYRYIGKTEDAKDILQDCFIKILTSIKQFEYKGEDALRSWMTRIVVNECLSFIRKNKSQEILVSYDIPGVPIKDDVHLDDSDIDTLTPEEIQSLIIKLPTGYRTVLTLFLLEGKSHKEIGELLGIAATSSASQYHRAKIMLAYMIKEKIKDKFK